LERQKKKQAEEAAAQKLRKPERKAVRDSKLLSFADDDDGNSNTNGDVTMFVKKKVSIPTSASSVATTLSTGTNDNLTTATVSATATSTLPTDGNTEDDFETRMLKSMIQKRKAIKTRYNDDVEAEVEAEVDRSNNVIGTNFNQKQSSSIQSSKSLSTAVSFNDDDDDDDDIGVVSSTNKSKVDEFAQAREQLLKSQRAIRVLTGQEAAQVYITYLYSYYFCVSVCVHYIHDCVCIYHLPLINLSSFV